MEFLMAPGGPWGRERAGLGQQVDLVHFLKISPFVSPINASSSALPAAPGLPPQGVSCCPSLGCRELS